MKLSQAFEFLSDLMKSNDEGITRFSETIKLVWNLDDANGQATKNGKDGCWDIEFEPTTLWLSQVEIENLFEIAYNHNLGVRVNEHKWQIYHYSDAEDLTTGKDSPKTEGAES